VLLLSPILFLQTVVDTADKDGSFGGFVVLLCLFEPIKIPEDRLQDRYAHNHDIRLSSIFRLQNQALAGPANRPAMPDSELP
jgi:hypothetical protein